MEENKVLTIEIPEEATVIVQKYDVERSSRRDIILYIMQNNINIPEDRFERYQKEYDEKYFAFETAKGEIEKQYVIPATGGKKCNWSLDYSSNIITVTLVEE